MSFTIEHQEEYKGMKIVCCWINDSHRCGYVGIADREHPLFGFGYDCEIPEVLKSKWEDILQGSIGKRGVVDLFCLDLEHPRVGILFDVHGGITYSGGGDIYPIESDLWWFGFDCAHIGDLTKYSFVGSNDIERTLEYVLSECKSLAEQLEEMRLYVQILNKGGNMCYQE